METEIAIPCNDVLSDDFKSMLDPYFTAAAPTTIREYTDWKKANE